MYGVMVAHGRTTYYPSAELAVGDVDRAGDGRRRSTEACARDTGAVRTLSASPRLRRSSHRRQGTGVVHCACGVCGQWTTFVTRSLGKRPFTAHHESSLCVRVVRLHRLDLHRVHAAGSGKSNVSSSSPHNQAHVRVEARFCRGSQEDSPSAQ